MFQRLPPLFYRVYEEVSLHPLLSSLSFSNIYSDIHSVTSSPEDLNDLRILNTSLPAIFSHASFLTPEGGELL